MDIIGSSSHGHRVKVNPSVYINPYFVLVAYIVMVSLNAYGSIHYKENATTVYGYTWIQPDGVTFSVWGVIYFLQALFVFSQIFMKHIREDERVILARPGYVMQCILNGAWLLSNAEANVGGLSSYWMAAGILVADVLFLFFGVYWYVAQDSNPYKYSIEVEAKAAPSPNRYGCFNPFEKLQYRWLVWYPISTNLAWIFAAASINVSSCAIDLEYLKIQPTAIGGPDFAIGIAFFASLLAIHNSITRQDLGYAAVTIWALWGIYRNQTNPNSDFPHEKNETLADAALLCIGLVSLGLLLGWGLDFFGAIPSKRIESIEITNSEEKVPLKSNIDVPKDKESNGSNESISSIPANNGSMIPV